MLLETRGMNIVGDSLPSRRLRPFAGSGTVKTLSRSPAFSFLISGLRLIAAVVVQLKAVLGMAPQYVVFYYLTHPGIRR
jgi:hypothetical protein